MTLKINPQKYNWPQKSCKLLQNKFPGSNWSVILMGISHWILRVFDLTWDRNELLIFWRVWKKKYFKKKNLWEEYERFWFFIMCHIFSIWLGPSGHSLLIIFNFTVLHSISLFYTGEVVYWFEINGRVLNQSECKHCLLHVNVNAINLLFPP